MNFIGREPAARATVVGSALVLALALTLGPAPAQDKTYTMKISTLTMNAGPDRYCYNYAAAIEKASGGRIKTEVYPASQLGSIARQIEGTQFGSIQMVVTPPEFMVGVDERLAVLTAPGLVSSMAQGARVAADPEVRKLMLGLGADKGLHGVGLFMAEQNEVVSKTPIRHLADFKGKKLRTFASQFQSEMFSRLGATPVAMSLGDVLPAIQQGAIDGAIAGMQVIGGMHFVDAAKFTTLIDQPAIFVVAHVNRKWYEALPADLQQAVDRVGDEQSRAMETQVGDLTGKSRKTWVDGGGELIELPADEQAELLKMLASVGADVAKSNRNVEAAYKVVTDVAQRVK